MSSPSLTIGDLVARTGVAEPTLRMWERRHGFPRPDRTPSGHRRYSQAEAALVEQVIAARAAGMSLRAAIERVQQSEDPQAAHSWSLFAALRRRQPELEPRLLRKRALIALSHAIEDETLARAERQVLFGCFQRERFYRREQARWQELAQGAAVAAVFADFQSPADPGSGPAEIPIALGEPLAREWALVCFGERSGICMAGREPPSSRTDADAGARTFETVWTVDLDVVREIACACAQAAGAVLPEVGERALVWLARKPVSPPREQASLTAAILNRTLAYIA